MQILKIYEVCGNQFVGIKRTAKYCSKPCREGAMKERHKILQAEKAERAAREKENEKLKKPIWQLNEEARKLGMSYGQYQAMKTIEMLRGEMK